MTKKAKNLSIGTLLLLLINKKATIKVEIPHLTIMKALPKGMPLYDVGKKATITTDKTSQKSNLDFFIAICHLF